MKNIHKPIVDLTEKDGNAFAIIGAVKKAMAKLEKENSEYDYIKEFSKYQKEAIAGDYNHLIQTTMKYCDVI